MINYNWSVNRYALIDCNISRLWKIITIESNLELFHPFCKNNRVIKWLGSDSIDEIEYLNGSIFQRNFCGWINEVGYDLYINQIDKPFSFVTWRLSEKKNQSVIKITVYPYLFNRGYKIIIFFPFFFVVRPLLSKYLGSVVGGLKLYAEKEIQVEKNYFGKHFWFS
tara:strand:+ start:1369 stop:1866 length:498 start_codon:yes stop_codon:yes gene_type:complete